MHSTFYFESGSGSETVFFKVDDPDTTHSYMVSQDLPVQLELLAYFLGHNLEP